MGRKPLAVVLGLAAVASIGALTLAAASAGGTRTVPAHRDAADGLGFTRVSRPAPEFTLPRLSGPGDIRVSQLAGQGIVVNFWASTCSVCRQEGPAIAQVARATRGQVRFVGIDTIDSRGAARAFARRYGLTFPLAFDAAGTAADRYGVPGLPETFFLSRSGQRIIGMNLGALTRPALTAILRQLYGVTEPA
jgi:cytochrome c biogenesis protein CcmG, thiol:disulfide interchange protein DsbE